MTDADGRRSRTTRVLLITGATLVAVALVLVFYSQWSVKSAAASVESTGARLTELMPTEHEGSATSATVTDGDGLDGHPAMAAVELDGASYIGMLGIPSLDLSLPVISNWDTKLLKTAPCRYGGSVYDGSLIIAGEDYPSHFGNLIELQPGDAVTFTDVDGAVFTYVVSDTESPSKMDAGYLESGDWDLTLCEYSSFNGCYLVIRCITA